MEVGDQLVEGVEVQWPAVKRRLFTILSALSLLYAAASCRRETAVPVGPMAPSPVTSDGPSPVEKPPAAAPTTRQSGVELTVDVPSRFRRWSPKTVNVTLVNHADVYLVYHGVRGAPEYDASVRVADSNGRQREPRRKPPPFSRQTGVLAPGEAARFEIHLSKLFDLPAGSYTLDIAKGFYLGDAREQVLLQVKGIGFDVVAD